jgi:hypothetical protein
MELVGYNLVWGEVWCDHMKCTEVFMNTKMFC